MVTVAEGRTELKSMVQERWASPQVPVLVLSCVPTATSPRVPAVNVVTALQLSAFSRPWMVSLTLPYFTVAPQPVLLLLLTQKKVHNYYNGAETDN